MATNIQTREEREAVKAAALEYLAAGLSVLPIHIGEKLADKLPQGKWEKWQTERATPEQVTKWAPWGSYALGVGILGGRISGNMWILDFDLEAEELYPAWRALLAAEYPGLAAALEGAPVGRTGKGYHVYLRLPEARHNETLAAYYAEVDGKPKVQKLIETRGEGGYVVAPPSPHPSGARYQWLRPLEAIPTLSLELEEQLLAACRSFDRREATHKPTAPLPDTRPDARPAGAHGDKPTLEELREMLKCIPPTTYEEWVAVLMAIHSAYPGPEGLALAVEWREWEPGEIAHKWKSFKHDAGGVGIGTLVNMAKQGGYKPPRQKLRVKPKEPEPWPAMRPHEPEPPDGHEPDIPAEPAPALVIPEGLREIALVDTPDAAARLNAAGLSIRAVGLPGGKPPKREFVAELQAAGVERVIVATRPRLREDTIRALFRAKRLEGLLVASWPGEGGLEQLEPAAAEEAIERATRAGAWLAERLLEGVDGPLPDLEEERLLGRAVELYTWLEDREPLQAEALLSELCDRLDIRYEEIRPRLERAGERRAAEETRESVAELLQTAARLNEAGETGKARELMETATRAISSGYVERPRPYTLAALEADLLHEPESIPLPWPELAGVKFPRAGLSVIAAESGRGKTTMMLNLLERFLHAPALAEEALYFYTYEEPASHIALKLLMILSGVMLHETQNFDAFRAYVRTRRDKSPAERKEAIEGALQTYDRLTASGRLVINDSMPRLEELTATLELIARRGRAAAVFVDYVQRIPAPTDYKAATRQLELAYTVQELRKVAVKDGLAVITGSQLNDKGELREARDIYHEAQVVLQLEPGQVDAEALMVKVDKQRSGISGITAALKWHKPTLLITSPGGPPFASARPRRLIVED